MTRFHYASTKDSDLLYLIQSEIVDPFFYLELDDKKFVFLPSTDIDAFSEESDGSVAALAIESFREKIEKPEGISPAKLAIEILTEFGVKRASVPASFPVAIADVLRTDGIELMILEDWCPERAVKSAGEIEHIKANFKASYPAFDLIERIISEAVIKDDTLVYRGEVLTSEFLKREAQKRLLDHDLINPASIIISCGRQAAMPHHLGSGPLRPHETIIVDIFPQSTQNHYFADMTRTYVKGEVSPEIRQMYEAVKEAQRASLAALSPGCSAREVYEISAQTIKAAGFDVGKQGFIHGLGHGLGVDVHEAPSLGARSTDILAPGHVVTIEPGLYYQEVGGVRIEDTVVITETGYQMLSNFPQNWQLS